MLLFVVICVYIDTYKYCWLVIMRYIITTPFNKYIIYKRPSQRISVYFTHRSRACFFFHGPLRKAKRVSYDGDMEVRKVVDPLVTSSTRFLSSRCHDAHKERKKKVENE